MGNEPIDAVYTWVDGAAPPFVDNLEEFLRLNPNSKPDPARFRDHGELRFSLRSLETYAPWIRHVHIVTSGQVPDWLDTTNPRLSVVDVATIFQDLRHLPTFNSAAIEVHLHRVPNLSKRFLHFDDDLFLGRSVMPAEFLTSRGGQYVHFEPVELPSEAAGEPLWRRSQVHTQGVLDATVGYNRPRLAPAHVPRLRDREVLTLLEQRLASEFSLTSSLRVRSPNNLYLDTLYSHFLLEEPTMSGIHAGRTLHAPSNEYAFIALEDDLRPMLRRFLGVVLLRPKFLCINDHLRRADSPSVQLLRLFLRYYFPRPSTFERSV
jgi:hypothetical protein